MSLRVMIEPESASVTPNQSIDEPGENISNIVSEAEAYETNEVIVKNVRSACYPPHFQFCTKSFNKYLNAAEFAADEFKRDLSDIVEIFVRKGRVGFQSCNMQEEWKQLPWCLKKKYALTLDDFPQEHAVSIRQVVSYNPLLVACILKETNADIYGSLNGLPRYLAFPQGYKLFPQNSATWRPLEILWMMWKVSFPESLVYVDGKGEFMTINYFFGDDYDIDKIVDYFGISPPSSSEVSRKIFYVLKKHRCDTLYTYFKSVFSIYAEDIWKFYNEHSPKAAIEEILLDECHLKPLEAYREISRIVESELRNKVIMEPIFKVEKPLRTVASPTKTRLIMDISVEKSGDSRDKEPTSRHGDINFQTFSEELSIFERALEKCERMEEIEPEQLDLCLNELNKLRDKGLENVQNLQSRLDAMKLEWQNCIPKFGNNEISSRSLEIPPEKSKCRGMQGQLKRSWVNDLNTVVQEHPKFPEVGNQYELNRKCKSKDDFKFLPKVLEIESQEERVLYEQPKLKGCSRSYCRRALIWDIEKRKLCWYYGKSAHTMREKKKTSEKIGPADSTSTLLQNNMKDIVKSYFILNPTEASGVLKFVKNEVLPLPEQFLRNLIEGTVSIPILQPVRSRNYESELAGYIDAFMEAIPLNNEGSCHLMDEIVGMCVDTAKYILLSDPHVKEGKLDEEILMYINMSFSNENDRSTTKTALQKRHECRNVEESLGSGRNEVQKKRKLEDDLTSTYSFPRTTTPVKARFPPLSTKEFLSSYRGLSDLKLQISLLHWMLKTSLGDEMNRLYKACVRIVSSAILRSVIHELNEGYGVVEGIKLSKTHQFQVGDAGKVGDFVSTAENSFSLEEWKQVCCELVKGYDQTTAMTGNLQNVGLSTSRQSETEKDRKAETSEKEFEGKLVKERSFNSRLNACSSVPLRLTTFGEMFPTETAFFSPTEAILKSIGDRQLQQAVDMILKELPSPLARDLEISEKTKQVRKVIRARMAHSRVQN